MTGNKIPSKRVAAFEPRHSNKKERLTNLAKPKVDKFEPSRKISENKSLFTTALKSTTLKKFVSDPFFLRYFEETSLKKKIDLCLLQKVPFLIVEGPLEDGETRLGPAEFAWDLYLDLKFGEIVDKKEIAVVDSLTESARYFCFFDDVSPPCLLGTQAQLREKGLEDILITSLIGKNLDNNRFYTILSRALIAMMSEANLLPEDADPTRIITGLDSDSDYEKAIQLVFATSSQVDGGALFHHLLWEKKLDPDVQSSFDYSARDTAAEHKTIRNLLQLTKWDRVMKAPSDAIGPEETSDYEPKSEA